MNLLNSTAQNASAEAGTAASCRGENGFTLVETSCAMVIILISLLGVVFAFTYAISYNAGNQSRAQGLALLQQEVEQIRAAKFTPTVTDATLSGGVKAARAVLSPTGVHFTIQESVDNDPFTAGVQDDTAVPNTTLKEITITTRLEAPSPGWQTAVPSTVVLRRTRSN